MTDDIRLHARAIRVALGKRQAQTFSELCDSTGMPAATVKEALDFLHGYVVYQHGRWSLL